MIKFESFKLDNGLEVYVHHEADSEIAVLNLLYKVGSRNETPEKTGFAHLFEHLMFGGSVNIPRFDEPLQSVGGNNNAFTSSDITNYYLTVPVVNAETGFWLESDRMLSLSFDPEALEVQRKVVIEEFKQRYLNQPYGDVWMLLHEAAYSLHPYRWLTIGKEVSHIEQAAMEDVKDFFARFYHPGNAILVVAGKLTAGEVKELSEKWFGPIPAKPAPEVNIVRDAVQTAAIRIEKKAKVPIDAFYRVYKTCGRADADYYATELMSDILGSGRSSRLYRTLVSELRLFSSVGCGLSGSVDPGLLYIYGKLTEGTDFDAAEAAIDAVIDTLAGSGATEEELRKVKNKSETALEFGKTELLNRAMNLAYCAFLGDPELINKESELIEQVTTADVARIAAEILAQERSVTLRYAAEKEVL